jgi:hypothetical protein
MEPWIVSVFLSPANAEILMNIQPVLNQTIEIATAVYNFFIVDCFYKMDLTHF